MVQNLNAGSNKAASERVRRKSEARRLDILRAAARVFRRSGVAAAGMRDIAAEADLSPGNLYYYFAGKDELLFFCQDRTVDRMLEAAEAARTSTLPIADQLRAVIRAHLHYTLEELEGEFATRAGGATGLVRVAASTVVAQYQLVPSLAGLNRRHPLLRVELEVSDRLAQKYLDVESYPMRREGEVRVTVRIRPEHIASQPEGD